MKSVIISGVFGLILAGHTQTAAAADEPEVAAIQPAASATVSGTVSSSNARQEAAWVVYISDLPAGAEDRDFAKKGSYRVDQMNSQFIPRVLVVPVHADVQFPNNDKFFHNVFSMSQPNIFDLGLYRGGDSRAVKMRKPGEVDVYCNIHPQMHMKILVVPNRFFAEVGADGKFSFQGVPAGTYTVTAWSSHHEPVTSSIEVKSGGETKASLVFKEERPWNKRHLRKDGSQYGRYE